MVERISITSVVDLVGLIDINAEEFGSVDRGVQLGVNGLRDELKRVIATYNADVDPRVIDEFTARAVAHESYLFSWG